MTTALYEIDFYGWALRQADLLKHEDFAELDLPNLIEEIEGLARSERRALENRLRVLLTNLLKFSCIPNGAPSRGWRLTIKEQRYQIGRLLQNNPSLKPLMPMLISDLYTEARDLATDDLASDELAGHGLPIRCPWTWEQISDLNWLP